jgi:hypothetical protein
MPQRKTTRREAFALCAGVAASAVRAQAGAPELVLRNSAGVTVRPIGDPNRPALGLSLPEAPGANAAVIELPEHAWHRAGRGDAPVWFYKMYTEDAGLTGQVVWSHSGDSLRYSMRTPSGFTLAGTATLQPDGLLLGYELGNPGTTSFAEVQAPTCIKLYRPFTDVFLERTFVHHAADLDLLASETPERLTMNAEEWLPCRYIVRCSSQAVVPAQRVERQADGITRYHKLRLADAPFISTVSSPGGWVAATHALATDSVWTNPARTCHHADSSAALPANSTARLALKFYVMRGGVHEVWRSVAAVRKATKL